MGINQSSITCVDPAKKCTLTKMKYQDYNTYAQTIPTTDKDRDAKLNKYVCGTKIGSIMQCCDKSDNSLGVLANGSNLINPVMDKNGQITEYQICKCTTKQCESDNCKNFKIPTKYELCKARSVNPSDVIHVNPYIDRILIDNTYPDCYNNC